MRSQRLRHRNMEGYAAVITGAHLFQRAGDETPHSQGGQRRRHAGRSFRAFFSLKEPAQLRYWASEGDCRSGRPPMGAVETDDISGVRLASPRRAGAEGEQQLQLELRLPDGKQRMVRIVPADAQQCHGWATGLTQATRGRHSAATSLAGAASRASEGWRDAAVEKEGLLFTPYLGSGVADEPPWLAVKVRVERRGTKADPSYVLRYGTAVAEDLGGARGGGLTNAETIGMKAVHSVRFGFGGPGARAATTETMPGDRTVDRKSCHFQFSIADTALDGQERVQQVARAAEAQDASSPWRRRQPPPSPPSHGPTDRVLRLRTRTTRECIEWVHLLRKLSVDRLLYPELLPLGVQRLLRALFQRALRNADGTVKEAELGRQLQHDRILSGVLPEEFRAPGRATPDAEDVAMAAVEAAAVAAWLFDGEDAAHEVLADAVAAAVAGAKGSDDEGEAFYGQTSMQASFRYERGMTLETFVHEMNSRHHEALETATAPYVICTTSEALAKLRSEFDLPEHLDSAGAVWVVEEKLGLPHELPPSAGANLSRASSTATASESMAASLPLDEQDHDRSGAGLGMPAPSADALMVAAPLAAVDHAEVIDEALVLIFAHLGQRVVLLPEEDPSTSKTVAMEGLMRVLNAGTAAGGGGAAAGGETLGQGQSMSSIVESSSQQLVNYDELDDDDHETSLGDVSPSMTKLRALKLGHASTSGLGSCDSEAAAADPAGSGWGPLKSTGLRDRPYGSYRRSRRKPVPSPRQLQQEQNVRAAMMQRERERRGGNPFAELGMVPSADAPISSSLQARLTISLRHSPRRSTSDMSESEEIAAALTPTDTYRHLSHKQQKEMRKKDFQNMMAAATAVAQTEEPAAEEAAVTHRKEARRVAEEKRRQSAEELAQKKAKAEAARSALSGFYGQTGQQGSRDSYQGGQRAVETAQFAPASEEDWASRVGAGTSAHSILTQLGLK